MRNIYHKRKRSQKGATLIEFLIYIGLLSFVITTAVLFSLEFVTTQAKVAAKLEATRNARFAASRIGIEIREATGINVSASVFDTNPGTLSLSTANPATDPTIFTVTDGVLTIQEGAGSAIPLTSSFVGVTEFTVQNVSTIGRTKAIRVHMKVEHLNPDNLEEYSADIEINSTHRIRKADGFSQ